jgi:hypothetical protein
MPGNGAAGFACRLYRALSMRLTPGKGRRLQAARPQGASVRRSRLAGERVRPDATAWIGPPHSRASRLSSTIDTSRMHRPMMTVGVAMFAARQRGVRTTRDLLRGCTQSVEPAFAGNRQSARQQRRHVPFDRAPYLGGQPCLQPGTASISVRAIHCLETAAATSAQTGHLRP